ncbi:ribonuclease III [candidate division WWE3 bacterium]|nr:ribonuclease III [candidate division WWE3 bacterium]
MAGFIKAQAEAILHTQIEDEVLFQTAFTHRSYLNEHPEYKNPSNERLEFLGDAVLQLLSSEYLFIHFPEESEGQLTNYRSAIVNTKSLGQEAGRIGYGELLLLSKGEEASGGREREYILANTFEAVLGALFLEKGVDFCRAFVEKELLYKTEEIVGNKLYRDPKSTLQEAIQEKFGVTPIYKVLETTGPDHDKTFKVGLFVNEESFGEGYGKSKQKGEQAAAIKGLDKLKSL